MKRVLMTTFALMLLASIASANGGHGGAGGGDFGRDGGGAIVGSDGTLYITRTTSDSGTNTATTTVTAVRSTGTVAWTATLNTRGRLTLSDGVLISAVETRATDGTVTTALTALNTATGAAAWTKTLSGDVTEIVPFTGGTYAIVVVPATTSGGTATRSIVAISNTGATLWTLAV